MRARHIGALGLLLSLAVPAVAQQPPTQPRRAAPAEAPVRRPMLQGRMAERSGPSPEALLRMREQLGLTEAQVTRLEALRQERLTLQRERMTEAMELRSLREAGQITPEQLRERMEARAARQAPAAGQQGFGERVRGVLTDAQRLRLAEQQVAQLRRQVQGGQMRGRAGDRGMRPEGRGMMPRLQGAPGQRPGAGPARQAIRQRLEERRMNPTGARIRRPVGEVVPPR